MRKKYFDRLIKVSELSLILIILLSIFIFSLETVPSLAKDNLEFFKKIEIVVSVIFTIEYFLRIVFSKDKKKYIFSFYGVIDLLSILPFYLSLGEQLQGIKIIRLFRILRLFKFTRYIGAIDRFNKSIYQSKEEFAIFFLATILILYFSAVGIYYFENEAQPQHFKSIPHSLWWAIATLTTVGYGDVYPITIGGKIFTFVILIVGIGIISVPAGIISSSLSEIKKRKEKNEDKN